ncbi:MAG: hypothetical protein P4L87_15125 [Formivibrio sp.]|nr:hypothetical protein [Formivibrio sp.]
MRENDLTLASVLYRLSTANAHICTDKAPATGAVLISAAEFPSRLRLDFRSVYHETAPMAVEAVVPGSPAALAGVTPGSGLLAIGDDALPSLPPEGPESMALQNAARRALDQADLNLPIILKLREAGLTITRTIQPLPACRASAELLTDSGLTTQSDDTSIQISATFLLRFSGDALAPLMAHELAHVILHHGQKLTAQHVDRGLLSGFGRNAALIRATENEADRLSVHLLANAGYDPELAVKFWRTEGRKIYPVILRSPTHGSPSQRAQMMQSEITQMECHIGGCDHGDAAFAP